MIYDGYWQFGMVRVDKVVGFWVLGVMEKNYIVDFEYIPKSMVLINSIVNQCVLNID
jgi:hypothetical protein